MARGFFSGVIAGTLVSAIGLGAASVLTGLPEGMAPESAVIDVPAGSEFSRPADDESAIVPDTDDTASLPAASVTAPEVTAPEADDLALLEDADTDPAAQPEAGGTAESLTAPETPQSGAAIDMDSETPVLPSPQAQAPEQPTSEQELSISTDPAQPMAPDVGDETVFPQDDPAATTEEPAVTPEPMSEPVPQTADAPEAEASAPEEPAAMASETADPAPEISVLTPGSDRTDEDETDGSSSTIGNLAPEVTTNRLPSVGDPPEEDVDVADDGADQMAQDTPDEESRPPLERFAAPFENAEGKPLMSIILIDDGVSPVGLQALESFPYPITFAIPSERADAEDTMAIYRAAGFEVVAMVDLPDGAGPQDAEVVMQSVFSRLPESVAIMEGTGSGLQSSRAAAEQLAPILLDSGHGAVFFPKGLNTAQQLLAREGVPAVSVFRDFDAKGQSATVIRRFLDQAAFKAGQEDAGVVMVGRLRPETVSALLLWGLQDRAGRVALAPLSAMLRGE